jgi:Reverse transcriptase (RNA-dependent DNA polymerase)
VLVLSLERFKIEEAELVASSEGSMCAITRRDGVGLVSGGGGGKAQPEPSFELRSGVGLVHSTDEAVEGVETRRGKGPAWGDLARGGQGPDTEPGSLAAQPRAGERGGPTGRPDPVHCPAASCRRQKRLASAGVDGMTVAAYEQDLEANLRDLCTRVHTRRYRPQPVRRVYIPKADGGQRPLGVPTLEDKIVQGAVAELLSAVYEVDFLGFSYGFRPGRNPHMALSALHTALMSQRVNWVLDADIRSFLEAASYCPPAYEVRSNSVG